ncbi:MAG: tetratricopeptide repeat protein [Terriglobales bacterium]
MRLRGALVAGCGLVRSPLLLVALWGPAFGLPHRRAVEPQWVEVRSPNFSVVTDAGEKRGREVARHFEKMRLAFGVLMTRSKINLSVPLEIVAFRNSKEMLQVAPLFNGKPTASAGLFQKGEDRSFIMVDMSVDDPWHVVFHEYAHRLMDGNFTFRTDPWFEEGFAEYFSTIEVGNEKTRVGRIPEETLQILHQMGMMGVSDLFRVQKNSRTYNETGDYRTSFYAESDLLVHYLFDNHLLPKVTVYFTALQEQNKTVEQAMEAAFGMSPEQFDKALRDYLASGRYGYYPIRMPARMGTAQYTVKAMSAVDAQAVVADIHAHSPDYLDKALAEFQDVLKTDPDNAAALRGVGFTYLRQEEYEQAAAYFRRAVERDSKDPRTHYYYAMLLDQEGPWDAARLSEIKKELQTSIALDPSLADAYSLLGFTQAISGEPEKGMATLQKALELAPRNEGYKFNLAEVCLVNGKEDDAIAILRNLSGSNDPDVALRASDMLEQAIRFKKQSANFLLDASPAGVRLREGEGAGKSEGVQETARPAVHFIKGKLVGVDCSAAPQAVLTITLGEESIRVHVRDRAHMVLIGADQFSCDWTNRNVAVSYRERPDGEGDAVSVEMQ